MKQGDKVKIIDSAYPSFNNTTGTIVGTPDSDLYAAVWGDGWYVSLDDDIPMAGGFVPKHSIFFFIERELEVINDKD